MARFFIVHRVGNLQSPTTEIPVGTGWIAIVRRRQARTVVAAVYVWGALRIDTTHFAVETQAPVRSALCRAIGFKGHIGKKSGQLLLVRLGGLAATESGNITNCAEEMGSAQSGRPGAARMARSDRKSVRPGFIRGEHRFDEFKIINLGGFSRRGGIIISRAAGTPYDKGQSENYPYPFEKIADHQCLSFLFAFVGMHFLTLGDQSDYTSL